MISLMIRVYHGSEHSEVVPEYGAGKPNNDFGKGFYCTENIEHAREWACKSNIPGFVHEYLVDTKDLKIIDLTSERFNCMEWLALLLRHRSFVSRTENIRNIQNEIIESFSVDMGDADIIKGPRADDSYFMFARDFISGEIPYSYLKRAMDFGNLGKQFVLMSEKSFTKINQIHTYPVDHSVYYGLFKKRDGDARRMYSDLINTKWNMKEEMTVTDILDKEWRIHDDRLF